MKLNQQSYIHAAILLLGLSLAQAQPTTVTVDAANGKAISQDLLGLFFEDINYSADGGLYAELIQNRSFEYTPGDRKDWNPLTSWERIARGGKGSLTVEKSNPLHGNNTHYAVLSMDAGGDEVGLRNPGFDGIAIKADETYDFSVFARRLKSNGGPLTVRLESANEETLGKRSCPLPARIGKSTAHQSGRPRERTSPGSSSALAQ